MKKRKSSAAAAAYSFAATNQATPGRVRLPLFSSMVTSVWGLFPSRKKLIEVIYCA